MRINIIHMGFLYSGGGERVVLEQTLRLRERGHEVKLFSPIIRWQKSFPDRLKEACPERIVPPFPFPFPFREAAAMLASTVLPFRSKEIADCDVLLCHSQPSMWIGYQANMKYGTPYVGYLHQLTTFIHKRPEVAGNWASKGDFLVLDGLLGVFGRRVARQLDRLCHLQANRLIFNSKWTRSLFEKEYGVSGDVCYPAGPTFMPKHDVSSSRSNTIITASRHYPWKRIDLAFQVLKQLDDPLPLLTVVGEFTPHTAILRQIAKNLGLTDKVNFTGFISDEELSCLYSRSLAYVQTSIYEPFGLGPIEAQSCGTPAVVWGDAGVKETVLDGETGFHARPYDIGDFAAKLQLILKDKVRWRKMSKEARVWAGSFTWDKHIDILEGILNEERR